MQVIQLNCFEVTDNGCDGRGASKHIGYFTTGLLAQAVKDTNMDYHVTHVEKTIRIYESMADFERGQADIEREAALSKLTDKEKRLLGIG